MRTATLLVHVCVLFLPVCGQWYDSVLSENLICEDVYNFAECLEDENCVLLFMDCLCVPRFIKNLLPGEPNDGHSVCIYADILLQLGQPTCCVPGKRASLGSFGHHTIQPHVDSTENNAENTDTTDRQITTAAKRKSDVLSKARELEKSVKLLLNSANLSKGSTKTMTTHTVRPYSDEVVIRKLFWYLKQYLTRKNASTMRTTRRLK